MISSTRRYGTEWLAFGLVFMAVFSELRFATTSGSTGNVEQWVNLTNSVFYGTQDFLFSYGPLYWLVGGATSMHDVYSYWASIAFSCLVQAFFWAVLFALCFKARNYILFGIAYILFFNGLVFSSAFFLWPLTVVAFLEYSQNAPLKLKGRWLFSLGVVAGFFFYVRFFYGTFAVVTFGTYFATRAWLDRQIRDLLFLFAGGVIAYVAVGTSIFHQSASLVDYLLINNQLNFGNSVDMTIDVDNVWRTYVAAALVFLCLNVYALWRRPRLLLTVNALFVVLFKIGFSRTDHYLSYFVAPGAVVICVMLFDSSRQGRLLFVVAASALYYIGVYPSFPGAPTRNALKAGIDFSVPYDMRMAQAYAQYKLPDPFLQKIGRSPIDVYPYNNEYIYANRLNYSHRPLFQSYMTLTPRLDAMNQQFFESPQRPKYVLWTAGIMCPGPECNPFEAFDAKLALNEDPLTSATLLLNYRIVDRFNVHDGKPAALFEANTSTTRYSERLIASNTMQLGVWYAVPRATGGVIRLKPALKFTFLGRLRNLLFRGAPLKIKYKLTSGKVLEFRTNVLNAPSGIWITPLPTSFSLEGQTVEAVMLETRASNYLQPSWNADWVLVPITAVQATPSRPNAN
ncbi:hypothetical protein [Caballeronia sp. LZ001]|uniref:hypothetical protein n=1 Tax=Caballeronia sp. LZ001 TaxID=3038553 RepID=UPI002855C11B|nr:hypothetical protein [Caballeronia sp. LZ001]MDR5804197.1 hypothetical protein [Caballeronia sp. LZ001]